MQRRSRFDLSRRQLLQAPGAGRRRRSVDSAAERRRANGAAAQAAVAALHAGRRARAELQHDRRLEAHGHRGGLHAAADPGAAAAVRGEDRRPLGTHAHRRRGAASARLRDGGPVDRHDAAGAERRRQLRRRQRPPDGVGQRRRRSIRSSRRRTAPTCRTSGPRTTRTRRRTIDRSRSACSARSPNTLNRMTYTAANAPISPEVDPVAAFTRIFVGVTPGGGMTPAPRIRRSRSGGTSRRRWSTS